MSKSYAKHKTVGICDGSNTEYYRDRQHHVRQKNKQRIRNVMANYNIEDFDDEYVPYKLPKKNDWDEPTDGTFKYTAKDIREMEEEYGKKTNMYTTKNKVKK